MGHARWSPTDWASYARSSAGKSRAELFDARRIDPALDPKGVALREARDSAHNPNSTGIVIGLDVTGSMGMIADALARHGLGTLVEEVLARKPVPDPQVMVMGIGDAFCDQAPLQVTQFEADIRIAQQLQALWLEHGGGGNDSESYQLPWYFAARHTAMDCFEKRGRKGYLFTVGDEMPPPVLLPEQIARITGDGEERPLSPEALLAEVEKKFHVFHLIVEEGSYARGNLDRVVPAWQRLLGQKALRLADHTKLAEVVVSAIQVTEGVDAGTVTGSWEGKTAAVVSRALGALVPEAPRRGLFRFGFGRRA
ncbi:hypothetical protein BKE38_03395 [Pseudoroseomonas deserti]|uniref:VWA domain-containing protein n=1 Tax=Teichococcus deserti TaxID=1817963 RepID=A0A1V2H6U5_9PROT|nr:hypothetical protein [Pseudoroseomonas deserti]ONG58147.1 hypothetical protein BKE38_03395 [Pseudoroseomonas deserti]